MNAPLSSNQTTLIERLRELETAELDVANSVDMAPEHTTNWQYAQTAREAREEIERLRHSDPETTRVDPLAGVRWICGHCTTVNGIDDVACLGCRKPREEHDSRVKTEVPHSFDANGSDV